MGKILGQIYKIIEDKAGIPGRIRLAQETGLSQLQAVSVRDKADLIKRCKKAATEILGMDINELLK